MYSVDDPVLHFGTGDYNNLRIIATFNSLACVDTTGILPGQIITIFEPDIVSVSDSNIIFPNSYLILDAYPNPFNSTTIITASNIITNQCRIEIYNILGELIKTEDLSTEGGTILKYIWDGTDDDNQRVSSGTYLAKAISGDRSSSRKITFLK